MNAIAEEQRILDAYELRKTADTNSNKTLIYENLAHLMRIQERLLQTVCLFQKHKVESLSDVQLLDIGCGDGNMLGQYLLWGASPHNLAGIELRPDVVSVAKERFPNIDLRCGSATELSWDNDTFDIISLHTVFTSILDIDMKQKIVSEIDRVIRPDGKVLWYDFVYNNPKNPDVKGVSQKEIQILFPNYHASLNRITLAPFIARRLPTSLMPILYPAFSSIPFLRTHCLGILSKRK